MQGVVYTIVLIFSLAVILGLLYFAWVATAPPPNFQQQQRPAQAVEEVQAPVGRMRRRRIQNDEEEEEESEESNDEENNEIKHNLIKPQTKEGIYSQFYLLS